MPIFSSILPGLRDLRVPLVVGALWMTAGFILGHGWFSEQAAEVRILSDARRAWEAVPDRYLLAILAFVAYLIGAAATISKVPDALDRAMNYTTYDEEFPIRLARRLGGRGDYRTDDSPDPPEDSRGRWPVPYYLNPHLWTLYRARRKWVRPRGLLKVAGAIAWISPRWLSDAFVRLLNLTWEFITNPLERYQHRIREFLAPPLYYKSVGGRVPDLIRFRIDSAFGEDGSAAEILEAGVLSPAAHELVKGIVSFPLDEASDAHGFEMHLRQRMTFGILGSLRDDLDLIAHRLQFENAGMYENYDRASAEAVMRLSVSFPLVANFLALAFAYRNPWPLLGLFLAVALFMQGWRRRYEADSIVWSAVYYGLVAVAELDGLKTLRRAKVTKFEFWHTFKEWERRLLHFDAEGNRIPPES